MNKYHEIKQLIGSGKLLQALEKFPEKVDEVIIIKSSIEAIKHQDIQGTITREEHSVELLRISKRLLELNERINSNVKEDGTQKSSKKHVKLLLFCGLFVLLILLWYGLFYDRDINYANFFRTDHYKILLFEFEKINYEKDCEEGIYCAIAIKKGIDDFTYQNNTNVEICILPIEDRYISYAFADSIGRLCRANLVIWGDFETDKSNNNKLINVKYKSLDAIPWAVDSSGQTGPVELDYYSELQEGRMTGKINDIVLFSMAYKHLSANENTEARRLFSQIDSLEKKDIFSWESGAVMTKAMFNWFGQLGDSTILQDITDEIALSIDNVQLYMTRAMVHINNKKLDLAVKDFSTVIEINSKHADAYYKRGGIYESKGLLDKAVKDYKEVLKLIPDEKETHVRFGSIAMNQKKYKKAIKHFQIAINSSEKMNCDDCFGMHYSMPIRPFRKWELARYYSAIGVVYENMSMLDSAYYFQTKAIHTSSNYTDALIRRGGVNLQIGKKLPEVISDMNTYLRKDSVRSKTAYSYICQSYEQMSMIDSLKSCSDNILQKDSLDEFGLYCRARYLMYKKSIDEADKILTYLVNHDTKLAPVYISKTLISRTEGDAISAIKYIEKAIELEESSAAYAFRGDAKMALGMEEDAKNDFDKAISMDSKNIAGYYMRYEYFKFKKQYPEALKDIDIILKMYPDPFLVKEREEIIKMMSKEK